MSSAVQQNRMTIRGILPLAALGAVAGLAPIWAGPFLALGVAGGIVVMFIVLRNPRIGLLLIAATIPLEVAGQIGQLTSKLPLTIPKILTILTLAAWFVHLTIGRARYRSVPWMYLLPAFWCIAAVSIIGAEEFSAGLEAVFRLLTTCIFFFLIVQLVELGVVERLGRIDAHGNDAT